MSDNLKNDILNIRSDADKYSEKQMKSILRAYKKSLNEIQFEIAKIYMEYTQNGELKIGKQQRYNVLKSLESKLIKQAREIGNDDLKTTTKILTDVFKESYYKTAFAINKGIETAIDYSLLRPEFVKAAVEIPIKGKMFSDRIWDNKTKLVKSVRHHVEQAMIQGKSVEKIARQVKKDFEVSAYESKRLINTEVARCVSQAQDEIYKQSDVVKKVIYDATLDMKTSEICQKLDGKYFDKNSDYPKIPQHPNCRSCYIPVVDGWSPSRKRVNEGNKPIEDYSNYEDWKKKFINS